ncbi:achelase-2-like [Convolutriloba macropyga]|uniref:achelase-2-like n=1 Tax=Convolutriloba macropyga TaxID=536237 RepID=UPI003F525845
MNLIYTTILTFLGPSCHFLVIDKNTFEPNEKLWNNHFVTSQLTSLIINGVTSMPKLFYARVLYRQQFCGATILSDRFVLTAGHCVKKLQHLTNILKIEVGDFTQKDSPRYLYSIERIFVNPLFNDEGEVPVNDIALVKTHSAIVNGSEKAIRLCQPHEAIITADDVNNKIIGFCGMGSCVTDASLSIIPDVLQQMVFKQTVFNKQSKDPRFPKLCPDELICVQALIEDGNICLMDDGGPLYQGFFLF